MKVLIFGGSKNIGYYCAQRLLSSGATVVFLLRNEHVFDNDENIKPFVSSGKAKLVKGDGLKEADVQNAWNVAKEIDGTDVDVCIFSIGGTPTFKISKGFVLDPPNLCAASMLNVLSTMPRSEPQPRFIVVSSTGLTKESHAALPFALKPLYGYLLDGPHIDKVGMERMIHHCAGWEWKDPAPKEGILPTDWESRLPPASSFKNFCVIRPALLIGEVCKADTKPDAYRAVEGEFDGGYKISRRDVAHFIVEKALADWDKHQGRSFKLAY